MRAAELLAIAMALNIDTHYNESTTSIKPKNQFKSKSTYGSGTKIDVRTKPKIGRNEICPKCDSGLKYKKCCLK